MLWQTISLAHVVRRTLSCTSHPTNVHPVRPADKRTSQPDDWVETRSHIPHSAVGLHGNRSNTSRRRPRSTHRRLPRSLPAAPQCCSVLMDPLRIESYLRSTCSVLDFDIGELWCAKKISGQKPLLKFVQLYTSPTYDDFHSLLVQPDTSDDRGGHDEDKHRFSPVICHGVCDGGQIVWANTRISEGLTGRIDLPLNTAVGVPICSIGDDLYILVLFAVGIIPMSACAVELLVTVARAVADGTEGFLSPSFPSHDVSPVNAKDFVGVFDISELLRKYSSEVEFHLLPIEKLQRVFDHHEILLFCDLFSDFKMTRDGRFTTKQLDYLRERSDSLSSAGSKRWSSVPAEVSAATASASKPLLGEVTSKINYLPHGYVGSYLGVYNADWASLADVDADSSPYKLNQCRFHEFMIAMLGMTVFEAAELWLSTEDEQELVLVAAVYRTGAMQNWVSHGEGLRLKLGADVPGLVAQSGRKHWDSDLSNPCGPGRSAGPRSQAARELGVHAAFGVPLPGPKGSCGAIVFYSSKVDFAPESLVIRLVEKSVRLLAAYATDLTLQSLCPTSELSPYTAAPSVSLARWLSSPSDAPGDASAATAFQQKLRVCRTLVNGRPSAAVTDAQGLCDDDVAGKSRQLSSCARAVPDMIYAPFYPPCYPDEARSTDKKAIITATTETVTTSSTTLARSDLAQLLAAGCSGVDLIPESEAAAVFALASFGRVEWSSFLEGSNNESELDGYASMKLDSDRIIGVYRSRCKCPEPVPLPEPLPPCKIEGCTSFVETSTSQYCDVHRSVRRCQVEDCNKCAQGATKFCIAHGGGRRCTIPGCFKGARDKFFCAAHGGGKRCTFAGCSKSAVGGSNLCTAHGGGKRCQFPQCTKSSQSNTMFCVRHGGGRSCGFEGCTKVARGKTEFCAAHGGGVRCRAPDCNKLAIGVQQLCRKHNAGDFSDWKSEEGSADGSMATRRAGDTDDAHHVKKKVKVT